MEMFSPRSLFSDSLLDSVRYRQPWTLPKRCNNNTTHYRLNAIAWHALGNHLRHHHGRALLPQASLGGRETINFTLIKFRVQKLVERYIRHCTEFLTARHFFCNICGVYTFHNKRIAPDSYGVNFFCLKEFDPEGIPVRQTIGAAMK